MHARMHLAGGILGHSVAPGWQKGDLVRYDAGLEGPGVQSLEMANERQVCSTVPWCKVETMVGSAAAAAAQNPARLVRTVGRNPQSPNLKGR